MEGDNSQEKTDRNKRQLVKFKESDNSQVFEANKKLYSRFKVAGS